MMKSFFLKTGFTLLLAAQPVTASPIEGCLLKTPNRQSDSLNFVQKRHIAQFSKPLVSSGVLHLEAGHKLIWETKQPIASTVTASPQGFTLTTRGKTREYTDRAYRELSNILLALHSLDASSREKLEQRFTLSCSKGPEGQFKLSATPRQAMLRKFLAKVEIQIQDVPRVISLEDERGDITTIEFQ